MLGDEHPAIEWLRQEKERAWDDGYRTAANGKPQEDNPYRKSSDDISRKAV